MTRDIDLSSISGSYTNASGERVQMSPEECIAILKACDEAKEKRASDMPDEQSAIKVMFQAYLRLKELGWREAVYCPKDGSMFKVIEAGSTGIFDCNYQGEWPTGHWLVYEAEDIWPSRPILFKLLPEAQAGRVVPDEDELVEIMAQSEVGADLSTIPPIYAEEYRAKARVHMQAMRPTLATLAAKLEAAETKASKADALAIGALTSYETAERELEAMTKRAEAAEKRAQEVEAKLAASGWLP